jgi:short-subunit dehydrogenase
MHIFITGGSKGIGRGMVVEFLKRGNNVSFTGTSESSVSKSSSGLKGNFLGVVCDVRIIKSIETAKDSAIAKYGVIDIWINNAGVGQPPKYFSDLSEDDIREVIDVNVYGMILGTNVALKEMKKQNHGIVYIMEVLGSVGRIIPKTIVYASSKRFLRYFSNAANKELQGSKEVFVGTVSPGMVVTNLLMKDSTPESMKMINILANSVEEVTPFIVEKMIAGKKNINWLTRRKVIIKFITSYFKKKK